MHYYFLHIKASDHVIIDEEGEQFDDLAAVRTELVRSAREIMSDDADGDHASRFVVTDDQGAIMLEFPFIEAITAH